MLDAVRVLLIVSVDGVDIAVVLRLVSLGALIPAVELPVPIVERVVPAGVVPMLPAGLPGVLALVPVVS